jgi:hypothetical protein
MGYLKSERERFEKLYEQNLDRFFKSVAENSYSSAMSAEFLALMPKAIGDLYIDWMADQYGLSWPNAKYCSIIPVDCLYE